MKSLSGLKAIIMAGGKGTRLSPFKPLLDLCGYPMYYWVYRNLLNFTNEIYLAITPYSPLIFSEFRKVITEGKGYEYDVIEAIKKVGFPVIIVPSDTPFIPEEAMYKLFNCEKPICSLLTKSGYVGISLWKEFKFNEYENVYFEKEIINVNTLSDYLNVKNLCKSMEYNKWLKEY
ncbi:NTP transferase domain-containing protein [Sulfurisphaera javensis]|uniref:NTP transferase domain-containing protein n=1 Tax=Sulfurisphaera javensis TaxID=2049879 RepID=A0AAT9GRY7_9CREN